MKMIQAIVRTEKSPDVQNALSSAGYLPMTKMSVLGRGKQRGLKSGNVYYDSLPKDNIYIACHDKQVDKIIEIIMQSAKVGGGTKGDGKIFIYPIERTITVSNKSEEV